MRNWLATCHNQLSRKLFYCYSFITLIENLVFMHSQAHVCQIVCVSDHALLFIMLLLAFRHLKIFNCKSSNIIILITELRYQELPHVGYLVASLREANNLDKFYEDILDYVMMLSNYLPNFFL